MHQTVKKVIYGTRIPQRRKEQKGSLDDVGYFVVGMFDGDDSSGEGCCFH